MYGVRILACCIFFSLHFSTPTHHSCIYTHHSGSDEQSSYRLVTINTPFTPSPTPTSSIPLSLSHSHSDGQGRDDKEKKEEEGKKKRKKINGPVRPSEPGFAALMENRDGRWNRRPSYSSLSTSPVSEGNGC